MSILLIHGVGGRPQSWELVRSHLDPDLSRVTQAVDVTVRRGQSVAAVAQELLDRCPGSHVMVGHSFGGMLAAEAALLDGARVRGLVLVSSIPGATARVAGINRALADDIEARGLENVAGGFAASLFAPGRLSTSPQLEAAFVSHMLAAGSTSVCAALRAIAVWDASDRLSAIGCPATVLSGAAEPDVDRQLRLAELIGGTHEVLSDTGHLAPLEAPEQVARAIAELPGVAGSPAV